MDNVINVNNKIKHIMNYFINRKILLNAIIITSFIIMAMINVGMVWGTHVLPNGNDMQFHWQEIRELLKSNSLLPQYAMNSFSHSGSATLTMYPYLFLYPYALLFKITKSIALSTYLMFIINTFISLIISFYSSKCISKNNIISYVFATMYSISFPLFSNSFHTYAIGMNNSFIFIPLVLFGFICWLKYNNWKMLSIGMSCIIFNSVIVSAFVPIFLFIWFLINIKAINIKKLINLSKAVVLTLMTTAIFWIPAVKLFTSNRLYNMLDDVVGGTVNGTSPIKAFISSLIPLLAIRPGNFQYLLTIYVLIGIIIGFIYFTKFNRITKQAYILSICVLFFSSNLFPWSKLDNTPLSIIQFPWRMYIIPQVILTYISAKFLNDMIYKMSKKQIIKGVICFLSLLTLIFLIQFANQSTNIVSMYHHPRVKSEELLNTHTNIRDYYPKASLKYFKDIKDNFGIFNNNNKLKIYPKANGEYKFYAPKSIKRIQLPIIHYNGTKYRIMLNGHKISTNYNKHQLIQLSNIYKGSNILYIHEPLEVIDLIARALTIISIPIYIILLLIWSNKIIFNKHI